MRSASTRRQDSGQVVDVATIQAEVKARLVESSFFGDLNINIETRKDVVLLGGFIDDAVAAAWCNRSMVWSPSSWPGDTDNVKKVSTASMS